MDIVDILVSSLGGFIGGITVIAFSKVISLSFLLVRKWISPLSFDITVRNVISEEFGMSLLLPSFPGTAHWEIRIEPKARFREWYANRHQNLIVNITDQEGNIALFGCKKMDRGTYRIGECPLDVYRANRLKFQVRRTGTASDEFYVYIGVTLNGVSYPMSQILVGK